MPLEPLIKKRATDEVYSSLRLAILTRQFLPGQRLLADELASQLGVSLTPVRHALQQLAVESLVEIHPRSGTYVASISSEDLADTFEIRLALELLAGRRCISRMGGVGLQRFESLLVGLGKAVRNAEDMKQHEALNLDFHRALFDLAGSKRLSDLYESLNAHIQIARVHAAEGPSLQALRARLAQEQAEHEAIVSALAARSLPKLDAALRAHITRSQESLISAIGARDAQRPADKPAKDKKR